MGTWGHRDGDTRVDTKGKGHGDMGDTGTQGRRHRDGDTDPWGQGQRDMGTWGHRDRDTGTWGHRDGGTSHGDGDRVCGMIVVWH